MEIITLKINSSKSLAGNQSDAYEISYRTSPDSEITPVSISADTAHGEKIKQAAQDWNRKKISRDELYAVIETAVEDNSTVVIEKALADLKETEAISSRIKLVGGSYLEIAGNKITGVLSEHLFSLIVARREDPDSVTQDDWLSLINFTESLYDNVLPDVRDQLYNWMSYQVKNGRLTLTKDGKFLGYKGLKSNFGSINTGPGIVNGIATSGSLDNSPGNVVEMERDAVDADRNRYCSTGLHVGSFDYANSFSQGKVVIVEVDPRDVVSVPDDYNGQKLRACKYRVIREVTSELTDFSVDFTTPEAPTSVEVAEELKATHTVQNDTAVAAIFKSAQRTNTKVSLIEYRGNDYFHFEVDTVNSDGVLGRHSEGYAHFKFDGITKIESSVGDYPSTAPSKPAPVQSAKTSSDSVLLNALFLSAEGNDEIIDSLTYNGKEYTDFIIEEVMTDGVRGIHDGGHGHFKFVGITKVEGENTQFPDALATTAIAPASPVAPTPASMSSNGIQFTVGSKFDSIDYDKGYSKKRYYEITVEKVLGDGRLVIEHIDGWATLDPSSITV